MEEPNKLEQQPNSEPIQETKTEVKEIVTEGVTPLTRTAEGYVTYQGALYKDEAIKELRPDFFTVKPDSEQISTNFGSSFPKIAKKGDVFVRVDVLPNKVFKFDGSRWIEINKGVTTSYLSNTDYLEFLVNKIDSGEYDLENLNEAEKESVLEHLRTQKS